MSFKTVSPKIDFPKQEQDLIEYWKANRIFEKSVESRPVDKSWTFLDGPPFITGMPHYGSLLVSIAKDVFPRFKTMQGYHVRRVWGWDCHGLPAENKVEQKLGIKSKREIEERVGIKKFIDECKLYVSEVSEEWEWYVDHIGRWVDFKNAYRTMDKSYMESVMWVFKQMYEKDLIYKGLRVNLYCPHCGTPISNFEVAMDNSYKEVLDAATTYKYQLEGEDDTFILAWSTTPWNKLVTPALAVNPKFDYVKVRQGNENYILAATTLKTLKSEPKYEVIEEFKGKDLLGKKFVPHYDYYKDKIEPGKKAFIVIAGDFVTAEEGTGVVTIAAYGIEDLTAMLENNVHIETHVDNEGTIKSDVPQFGGMYYLKANKAVNEDLASRGLIYHDEEIPHNVPVCWRCSTRLYFAPIDAWFVNVQKLKDKMKQTNEDVNWFPNHFKHGRFLKSLEGAPDWNISRNRYWGSPVPVWECACGERFVPGSIAELEEASGVKIDDLHKPEIDEVLVICKKCGENAYRVPEVLDSWIEAGSASFAERHFPFDKNWKLEDFYPPDFIVEYTGQIRTWFYVLHVIGASLYGSNAFKNVGVTGVILGTDGRKMSKNYGNYPDPRKLLETYGGDALRLYLMGSPVMKGEDIIISEENYRNQVRGTLLILWNTYNFFVSYANADGWDSKASLNIKSSPNVLDEWIISLLNGLIKDVTEALENYDTVIAISKIEAFVNNLSTWYIRRSRERVGPATEDIEDKGYFYETCFNVLVTLQKVLAPFVPFITEEIYKNLTSEESVHLSLWPDYKENLINPTLEQKMDEIRMIVESALAVRKEKNIKVKQPLKRIGLYDEEDALDKVENEGLEKLLKDELNIKKVEHLSFKDAPVGDNIVDVLDKWGTSSLFFLDIEETPELVAEAEAREIIRRIQAERKNLGTALDEKVSVEIEYWPDAFESEIKRKALVKEIKYSEEFKVIRNNKV